MTVNPGLYLHYKGGLYVVLSSATHTETGENLVIYFSKDNSTHWWARPASHFQEHIEKNNTLIPRFRFIRKLNNLEIQYFKQIENNS